MASRWYLAQHTGWGGAGSYPSRKKGAEIVAPGLNPQKHAVNERRCGKKAVV